jgi:6-phosphogluconolactonase (cycloisomerase 2 family)
MLKTKADVPVHNAVSVHTYIHNARMTIAFCTANDLPMLPIRIRQAREAVSIRIKRIRTHVYVRTRTHKTLTLLCGSETPILSSSQQTKFTALCTPLVNE